MLFKITRTSRVSENLSRPNTNQSVNALGVFSELQDKHQNPVAKARTSLMTKLGNKGISKALPLAHKATARTNCDELHYFVTLQNVGNVIAIW